MLYMKKAQQTHLHIHNNIHTSTQRIQRLLYLTNCVTHTAAIFPYSIKQFCYISQVHSIKRSALHHNSNSNNYNLILFKLRLYINCSYDFLAINNAFVASICKMDHLAKKKKNPLHIQQILRKKNILNKAHICQFIESK